jgi:glycosyltransferase involved in cell wall biosynthesis
MSTANDGRNPRVSIGMPVRNGQKYIREAIDSIVAQTFTDWELIVCDNASTDNTEQIVREYAARDSRIRYHKNETNIGPAGNHNVGVRLSRGEFFRWHAHDDMIGPEYLARCVELLDRDPDAVLAHTKTQVVDEKGKFIEDYNFVLRTDALKPAKRFAELVLVNHRRHRAVEIFGLMRSSALRETPLEGAYARGDSVLLVRMALRGRFVEASERLFLSRSHPSQSMQQLPSRLRDSHSRARFSSLLGTGPLPPPEWWDPSLKDRITFPEWKVMGEYWRAIGEVKLPAAEKLKCHGVMLAWTVRNLHKLARDVIIAAEQLLSPAIDRLRPSVPKSAGPAPAASAGAPVGATVSSLQAAAKKA